jgi:hypothetical protein
MSVSTTGKPPSSLPSYLFLSLLAISLAGNVYLTRKMTLLKGLVDQSSRSNPVSQVLGTVVDHVSISDLAGKHSTLQLRGESDTILYIYSPKCGWCAANYSSIISLANQRGGRYRFVGLSILPDQAGLEKYLAKHPYPFPSYIDSTGTDLSSLGFVGTPHTVLIGRDGKIQQVWPGAYGEKTGADIAHFFSLNLPDISHSYANAN